MRKEVKVGASIACADFLNLEAQIKCLDNDGIDFYHIDIMDGSFVPNFALNADLLKAIRKITPTPIHTHLMIWEPEKYIPMYIDAGSSSITVHQESTNHLQKSINIIRNKGAKVFVAINPATSLSVLEYVLPEVDGILIMTVNPGFAGQTLIPYTIKKIKDLREKTDFLKLNIDIQTDGNVSLQNIPLMVKAGANMLVGGSSSLFIEGVNLHKALQDIKNLISGLAIYD